MVNLAHNEEFRELGIEGPEKNAKQLCEVFQKVMGTSPQAKIKLPWRCDMVVCRCWNGEVINV